MALVLFCAACCLLAGLIQSVQIVFYVDCYLFLHLFHTIHSDHSERRAAFELRSMPTALTSQLKTNEQRELS